MPSKCTDPAGSDQQFAPRCYHCRTPIIDERFITLDDPALGKRTYHEQHFFCAECGDPFLAPSSTSRKGSNRENISISGDGEFDFEDDDVGFTVYKGHPYCETCHVRLRMPKCKKCKKSIRDGMQAVEALGGKWCWECFVCAVRALRHGSEKCGVKSTNYCFPCPHRAVKSRSRNLLSSKETRSLIASHASV